MKYIKSFLIAALSLLPLSSCSDFLDAENKSSGGNNAEDFFSSDPEAILPVAYNSLRSFGVNVSIHEHGSDLFYSPKSQDCDYAKFIHNAEDGGAKSYYTNGYSAIQKANALIHYGGEGSSYADEGRFVRGLVYYLLTQQFGGVPYITHYVQDANRDYPRTPLDELYANLISDLEDLYANSSLPTQDHNGRASKQAVAALLAKVYLAAAWDIDTDLVDAKEGTYNVKTTDRFKKAAEWSEKAINGIQLTMSFADKWSPYNERNAEEIFSIQYERAGLPSDPNSSGHDLQNQYTAYYGDCKTVSLKPTKGGGDQNSPKSLLLFEKGDQRFEATFMTTFYSAERIDKTTSKWGDQGYYAYYNAIPEDLAKMPISLKFFPYYYTDAEIEQWLNDHKDQCFLPAVDAYNYNTPFAARLEPETVTKWTFGANGTFTKTTVRGEDFYAGGAGMQGFCVKKFDDPATTQMVADNGYRDIVLFHVSQMYLVCAEANYMAGNESAALSKINDVRRRAGLANLGSFGAYQPQYVVSSGFAEKPLDLILDEYARECYAEQTRYVDLRRTKQLIRYNLEFNRNINSLADMQSPKGEFKWLRPIPSAEFDFNTALTAEDQNPGY